MKSFLVMCLFLAIAFFSFGIFPSIREAIDVGSIPLLVYIVSLICAVGIPAGMNKRGK